MIIIIKKKNIYKFVIEYPFEILTIVINFKNINLHTISYISPHTSFILVI